MTISGTNSLSVFDGSGLPQRNEPSHLYFVIKQSASSSYWMAIDRIRLVP